MTQQQRIVATFVSLAEAIAKEFDPIEFLHGLLEQCVELLECSEAGLLLADAAGVLRVMASSSERAEALEILESQNDEGPCFQCFHRGRPVFSEDLAADRDRWPTFTPAALGAGFKSVQAIPMRAQQRTIGALILFRVGTGRLTESHLAVAQGMADIAAIALLQQQAIRDSREVVAQLQSALNSRVVIEQAKGVLAEQAQTGVENAFNRMRSYARRHNRRLNDIAHDVIDGELNASALSDPADPRASERTQ